MISWFCCFGECHGYSTWQNHLPNGFGWEKRDQKSPTVPIKDSSLPTPSLSLDPRPSTGSCVCKSWGAVALCQASQQCSEAPPWEAERNFQNLLWVGLRNSEHASGKYWLWDMPLFLSGLSCSVKVRGKLSKESSTDVLGRRSQSLFFVLATACWEKVC